MNTQDDKNKYCFITPGVFKGLYTPNNFYKMEDFIPVLVDNKPKMIGEGRFSEVYLYKNKNNDCLFALKKILVNKILESGNDISIIQREINIHSRIQHENIVQFYGVTQGFNEVNILLEYCKNGSIYELIEQNGFDEHKTYKYFSQVVNAVYFLHKNNLVHRDIKPENILLNSDKIKLCDFGWCCETNVNNRNSFCGTFEYMAPEIINELPYGKPVDIWALGILLYEFYFGVSPFNSNKEEEEQNKEIIDNILNKRLFFPDKKKIPYDMKNLIINMLNNDVSKRYNIDQVVAHPWFKKCKEEIDKKNNYISNNINNNYNSYMTYQDLNISKITKITKIEKIIKNKDDDVLYNSSIKNKTPIKTSYNSGQIFSKQKGYESKHFSSKLNIFPKKLVNIDINTAEDNSSSPYIERSKTNRDLKTIDYNNYNDAKINKDSFIKKINTIPNKRMIKNNTGNLFALNKNNENYNNSDEDSYIQSSIFFPMDNILEETKNKKIDENVFNDQKHASVRKIENNNILKNHSSLNVNYMNNGMQNQKKYNHNNNITNNYYLNNNIYNINYYNQYNDINTDNNNRFRINNYLIGYPFQNSYFPNNNYE
jgi:serine/threonine protein kinase